VRVGWIPHQAPFTADHARAAATDFNRVGRVLRERHGLTSGRTSPENDVVLGAGQIDIPAVLKAARKAGVAHAYIEDESPLFAEQVPQSIAYLQSLAE
jgi:hypothetical protein